MRPRSTFAGSNYDAIVANLDGRDGAETPTAGPVVRVYDLYVRDVTAQLRIALALPLTLEVPEIHLRDTGERGLDAAREALRGVLDRR